MMTSAIKTTAFVEARFRHTGIPAPVYAGRKVNKRKIYDEETGTYRLIQSVGNCQCQCDCTCESPGDF